LSAPVGQPEGYFMNYKQTQQFNERKVHVLLTLAFKPVDLDETGTLIPIRQIEKRLNISNSSLHRCLHSLENDGMIICTHRGYETGIKSMRWLVTDKADSIIYDEGNIRKFNENSKEYYKSLNESRVAVGQDDIKLVKIEGGNIGYNVYGKCNKDNKYVKYSNEYNNIINIINNLTETNNKYNNNLQSISNLRLGYDKKKKKKSSGKPQNIKDFTLKSLSLQENISHTHSVLNAPRRRVIKPKEHKPILKIKGRVYNALCFTKSGKQNKVYLKSDKRPYRKTILSLYGFPDYKEIYDITNQIPRLTYILQGGNFDDIPDFYIIDGMDRELVKKYSMSAYFDKTKKLGAHHIYRRWVLDKKIKAWKYGEATKEKKKEMIYRNFSIVWDHYRNLLTPIGSEIFLWTALWEQLIIKEARERLGVCLLNVYDGFYYNDNSIIDELNNIVKETAITVRQYYNEITENETSILKAA
jgi:DNA-binding IscR family transcriptional regulator